MNALWIATLITSAMCFLLKFVGYSLPESLLNRPIIQRINSLIPIALLSALVAVQTFGADRNIVVDHRLAGVGAAAGDGSAAGVTAGVGDVLGSGSFSPVHFD